MLPLQFGIVFGDADAVVSDFLQPRKAELEKLLRELEGKVELSVKGFYVEEAILAEIIGENRRVAGLREATRTQPDGAATEPGSSSASSSPPSCGRAPNGTPPGSSSGSAPSPSESRLPTRRSSTRFCEPRSSSSETASAISTRR